MISLRKNKSGFTIIELLIVIIVIGILAAIVIVSYSGVQQKSRDTQRKTDINALQGQLEAYFANNAKYPTLTNVNDTSFRSTDMKGLDAGALQDPKWSTSSTCKDSATPANATLAASASTECYSYVATPSGCDNSGTDCTGYTLTANLEGGGTYTKSALN